MSENNLQSHSFNPFISPKISDMLVNKFHSNPPISNDDQSTDLMNTQTENVIKS